MANALDIERMALEEKLRAMEALWDDLCRKEESVPVQQWHKDTLDERERAISEGKSEFVDWDVVKKRLGKKLS